MVMKWWFVSYQFVYGNKNGFGNIELEMKKPLNTRSNLKEVKEYIEINLRKQNIYNANVVILNFIKLEDE